MSAKREKMDEGRRDACGPSKDDPKTASLPSVKAFNERAQLALKLPSYLNIAQFVGALLVAATALPYDSGLRTVAETLIFQRYAAEVWSEEELNEFITWIAANPTAGHVIPGSLTSYPIEFLTKLKRRVEDAL